MFCKACGGEILDTAVICVKCGSATTATTAPVLSGDPRFIVWGWVTAFIIPILGLGFGIYNLIKGKVGHGIGQILVSLFMWGFWAGFFRAIGG